MEGELAGTVRPGTKLLLPIQQHGEHVKWNLSRRGAMKEKRAHVLIREKGSMEGKNITILKKDRIFCGSDPLPVCLLVAAVQTYNSDSKRDEGVFVCGESIREVM